MRAIDRLRAALQEDEIGLDEYDAAMRRIDAGDDPGEILQKVLNS